MKLTDKTYDPTMLEEDEKLERERHEKEMYEAEARLEKTRLRRRDALLCAAVGFVTGILYVLWICFGERLKLPGGKSFYEAYISLAGGNGILCALLDFLPPVILSVAAALIIVRKRRGKTYFLLTSLIVCAIVVFVFLLYMSLMAL